MIFLLIMLAFSLYIAFLTCYSEQLKKRDTDIRIKIECYI